MPKITLINGISMSIFKFYKFYIYTYYNLYKFDPKYNQRPKTGHKGYKIGKQNCKDYKCSYKYNFFIISYIIHTDHIEYIILTMHM